ncbi:MAG: acyltransferase [Firmicutes bacterium]|nr:acyltransferase [Bacillota bacterium]
MSQHEPTEVRTAASESADARPAAPRYPYLSLIRVISCIGIVFLHTYYAYVSYFPAFADQQVWSYAVRNAMMWAVPCFVMVTGALLLDPERTVTFKKLFSRYILRAVLAIVIFTLVFYAFDLWLAGRWPRLSDLGTVLLKIYSNDSWSHMWYLYMLIGLYLLMPAFRLITKGADERTMRYLLLVGLIFMLVLPTIETISGVKSGFYITVYTVYPFYLFLGYALHKGIVRIPRWLGAPMLAAGILASVILTRLQMVQGIGLIRKLISNYSFVVIGLMAAGLFSLLRSNKKTADSPGTGDRLLTFLDAHSFGIYLLHYLLLKIVVTQIAFNPYQAGGNIALIAVTLVIFLLSLGLCWCLRLIPFVKKFL